MIRTNNYPPSDDFMIRAEEMLPSTLSAFMEALVPMKRKVKDVVVRKSVAISHPIISTVRSRSFIFPGIGYYIHRKFASKNLIKLLSSMGFSATHF